MTTGGQRIHDYREITAKMEKRGMDPEDIASYLMIFKYGMRPTAAWALDWNALP